MPRPESSPAGLPMLMVPPDQLGREIDERMALVRRIVEDAVRAPRTVRDCRDRYDIWNDYNTALLRRSFDTTEEADSYARDRKMALEGVTVAGEVADFRRDIEAKVRNLRSLKERLPLFRVHDAAAPAAAAVPPGTEVFVVHGRDAAVKTRVATFLTKLLGREPILLHDQPDRGRTVIEKFEAHAESAAAAVVLLTGDDEVRTPDGPALRRARQNVVLELGYFIGKLGRDRVVILFEEGVELPTELDGVLSTALDAGAAWRNAVARELQAAGFAVDLQALL